MVIYVAEHIPKLIFFNRSVIIFIARIKNKFNFIACNSWVQLFQQILEFLIIQNFQTFIITKNLDNIN